MLATQATGLQADRAIGCVGAPTTRAVRQSVLTWRWQPSTTWATVVSEVTPTMAGSQRFLDPDPADGAVTAALAAGDHDRAMEILVAQHAEQVYRYCRRMLGDNDEGDDTAQLVFVQAFKGLTDLQHVRSIRAWLLGIARNRCVDRLRALRRGPVVLDGDDVAAIIDRVTTARTVDDDPRVTQALDDCLDKLDARSRTVLVLRFHDELSYEEISRMTDDTSGALRVRLVRALAGLRRCLERKGVQA